MRRAIAGWLLAGVLLVGCGGDDDSGEATRSAASPSRVTATATAEGRTVEEYLERADAACERASADTPVPQVPQGDSFTELAAFLREGLARYRAIREALESVEPPTELRIKVGQYIDTIDELSDLVTEVLEVTEREDRTALENFRERLTSAGNDFRAQAREIGYRECDPE